MECQAIVSSVEPEKRYFHINGERRPSFRLGYFDYFQKDGSCLPIMAEIPLQLLKNSNAAEIKDDRVRQGTDKLLPVYIQSHAIRRFTERMDATNNTFRNNVYSMSFKEPSVITTLNGQRMVKAIDEQRNCVGYFPYRQLENAILILSFLPLASPIVPEEAALFKELGVLMEDSRYIGMDKLSFYIKTDFGSVPRITEALKKVGMWHLTEIKPENAIERKEFDFLKKYFMENTRATSVQDQI